METGKLRKKRYDMLWINYYCWTFVNLLNPILLSCRRPFRILHYRQIKHQCKINGLPRGIFMSPLVLFPKKGLWRRIWTPMSQENLVDKLRMDYSSVLFHSWWLWVPGDKFTGEYQAINLLMVQRQQIDERGFASV